MAVKSGLGWRGKALREINRLRHQVTDALSVLPDRSATRRHDARFPAAVTLQKGAQVAGSRVALVLLYQPAGIAPSTLAMLDHVLGRGYVPLVVSNAPLDGGAEAVLARSAFVMERPNFGYDFGGYRDGLRVLEEQGLDPEWLLILNDSIWFPLREDETMIARMEASGSPFLGAMYELKGNRVHRSHYESYFFLVSRAARRSAAFCDYWRDYLMSSTKRKVLQRGEKGFSQAMFAGGYAPSGLASRQAFLDHAATADDGWLRKTLDYAAYSEDALEQERDAILALPDGNGFRDRARDHIRRASAGGTYHDTFHWGAAVLFGLSFMKKRNRAQTVEMRRQYLRAVAAGDLAPPLPVMLAEIRASVPEGRA